MAYLLERLADGNGVPITPAETDLAFFVTENGMHGYANAVPPHIAYWKKQRSLAVEYGEPAREGLANQILTWLTLNDTITHPGEITLKAATNREITPEVGEGFRRHVIGGLALSFALRRGLAINLGGLIGSASDADGEEVPVGSIAIDLSVERNEREWPYEPRLHVVLPTEAVYTLADPADDPMSGWSRFGKDLLVETRYPGDITPPYAEYMRQQGAPTDPARSITYVPHLIAIQSPLRS